MGWLRLPERRVWIIVTLVLAADFLVLPFSLWDGPGWYNPLTLLLDRGSGLAGEWFLINLVGGAAVLLWLTNRRTRPTAPVPASQYGSHGTARFARDAELRSYLKASGPGLILGKAAGGLLVLPPDLTLPFNRNVTVLGSSGTRKTRTFVQPNLLQEAQHRHSSIICVDPKGENFARSAQVLREAGFEVRLLNFLDMAHSDRWNPLAAVADTTDAADLAVNLVANTVSPTRPRAGDPFWDMAEQSFITALVLYVIRHRPEAERHMASVLEVGADLHPNNLDHIFLALPGDDPARRFYRTFLHAEEKVRAGVVAGIGSRMQLWNIPELVALTAASDFNLADLGTRHIALFLVIPDSKVTYAPILALFWQQAFQVLYTLADKHGGVLPVPVRCVMDEIANCGYIPDYAQKKSTMRSRRVSTEEVWQSLSQLKNRYPSTWGELLANSDHLLFLGANDVETAQYISQLCGTTTLGILGTGATAGTTGGSSSTSNTYTGRPLLTPDECLRLPHDMALLFPKGHNPGRVEKFDFTAHPLAPRIALTDHRQYAAPPRADVRVTDVAALLDAVTAMAQPLAHESTLEADPSRFADDESHDRGFDHARPVEAPANVNGLGPGQTGRDRLDHKEGNPDDHDAPPDLD